MKKIIAMILVIALTAAISVGATMAYLQDTDEDVNVMTLGNVQIEQNEHQRVDNTKFGVLTEADIEDFVQAKPILPYVDNNLNNAMRDDYAEVTFPGGYTGKLFVGENAIDKLVSVTNTGKSDAYVRTIIALEAPTNKIDLSFNSLDDGWKMDRTASSYRIEVDGVKYDLFVCYYNKTLKPGETTPYSLMQIILDWTATNEDAAAFGNTYDVLVVSQAVQTAGFADAQTALNAGFGVINANNHPWSEKAPAIPTVVSTAEELKAVLAADGNSNILLANDLVLDGEDLQLMDTAVGATAQSMFSVIGNKNVTIDLNGKTITADTTGGKNVWTVFYAGEGANLTIQNGRVEYNSKGRSAGTAVVTSFGSDSVITLKNVEAEQIGEGGVTQMIYAHGAAADLGKIFVEGGTYIQKKPTSATNPFYEQGAVNTNIIVSGGTFKVYHDVDLTKYMTLAEGYKLELINTDADGADWYAVVAE